METKEILKTNLNKILDYMKVSPNVEIDEVEENNFRINISGDNLNFLIGFRGQSLEALQHFEINDLQTNTNSADINYRYKWIQR